MPKQGSGIEAVHEQKMIEIRFWFWTMASLRRKVLPKHAWTGGVVRIRRNEGHGIGPADPISFHSLLDVGSVIEQSLIKHGIVLHPGRRMKKYMTE